MSEYINNVSQRKAKLKNVLEQLHRGKSVDEVRAEFSDLVREASPAEIAEIEQLLMDEGTSAASIQLLCDVHVAVFKESLEKNASPETSAGHPVFIFRSENSALKNWLDEMSKTLSDYEQSRGAGLAEEFSRQLDTLMTFERHYLRKENLLFPFLERYGFTAPSAVMWGIHDEIRADLKTLKTAVQGLPGTWPDMKKSYEIVAEKMNMMVYKEEKILFPAAIERLAPMDWLVISEQESEFGLFQPTSSTRADAAANKKEIEPTGITGSQVAAAPQEGALNLQTGSLTLEQINLMLTHLPVDITFVDEKDEVRFFSQTPERIFVRQAAIIGRKVQNCHPPQSVSRVQQIVDDFRAGRRDTADFWIQMQGKFVYIRYFAVRDAHGAYRGTLEVTQDVAGIRQLEGERRILDEPAPQVN